MAHPVIPSRGMVPTSTVIFHIFSASSPHNTTGKDREKMSKMMVLITTQSPKGKYISKDEKLSSKFGINNDET